MMEKNNSTFLNVFGFYAETVIVPISYLRIINSVFLFVCVAKM